MNRWMVLNDRLGYCWLKTMTSSSFREDIGDNLQVSTHQHCLLGVIWQVAVVAAAALVAISNTQTSSTLACLKAIQYFVQ